ncbi:MAG: NAD(+)/NADH kinase [Lachnospiraceae bacterium]|nr:NAD(+)/NADH kinase [Lachnospiraceae bacterium]
MKYFYIIANPKKDVQLKLTKEIYQYILAHGGVCGYQVSGEQEGVLFEKDKISNETECILVVGGDGTLLGAARNMADRKIPLIGVNTGHVGYLCELEADTVIQGVKHLLEEGEYTIEQRMLLAGSYMTKEGDSRERIALNDIVIHRSGRLQVVNLIISVNGKYLNTYSADGMIIATPTGSTAYSMSAGGPIVDPKANLLLITPISPHNLNAKSIVLGAEDEIAIEIAVRNKESEEKLEISFDGEPVGTLHAGEKIVIKKAQVCTRILKLSRLSFLESLRKKLQSYT